MRLQKDKKLTKNSSFLAQAPNRKQALKAGNNFGVESGMRVKGSWEPQSAAMLQAKPCSVSALAISLRKILIERANLIFNHVF
jgi:hypothetical protein